MLSPFKPRWAIFNSTNELALACAVNIISNGAVFIKDSHMLGPDDYLLLLTTTQEFEDGMERLVRMARCGPIWLVAYRCMAA